MIGLHPREVVDGVEVGVAFNDLGAALLESRFGLDAHGDAVFAVAEEHLGDFDDIPPGADEPDPQVPVFVAVAHRLVVSLDGEVGVAPQEHTPDDRVREQKLIRVVGPGNPHGVDVFEEPCPARGERCLRFRFEGGDHLLEELGIEFVVGVEGDDVGAAGRRHTRVARRRQALVRLADDAASGSTAEHR